MNTIGGDSAAKTFSTCVRHNCPEETRKATEENLKKAVAAHRAYLKSHDGQKGEDYGSKMMVAMDPEKLVKSKDNVAYRGCALKRCGHLVKAMIRDTLVDAKARVKDEKEEKAVRSFLATTLIPKLKALQEQKTVTDAMLRVYASSVFALLAVRI